MQQQASFWSDIKELEERLVHDPDSLLFARLSNIYLKVNLVDDALHTARRGVESHPAYVAGQRALAMACHAKGLQDECRSALEMVTAAVPEDMEAQRMLARLLTEAGEAAAAVRSLRRVLDFHPQDEECRSELQALERALSPPEEMAPVVPAGAEPIPFIQDFGAAALSGEEPEIIELSEDDMLEEELEAGPEPPRQDPLSTATLAELYVQQGFVSKALEIYRALHADNPGDPHVLARIAELESGQARFAAELPVAAVPPAQELSCLQEEEMSRVGATEQGRIDEVVATLEGWLDTIGRIKACR